MWRLKHLFQWLSALIGPVCAWIVCAIGIVSVMGIVVVFTSRVPCFPIMILVAFATLCIHDRRAGKDQQD